MMLWLYRAQFASHGRHSLRHQPGDPSKNSRTGWQTFAPDPA